MNWQERNGAIWVEAAQVPALVPGVPQRLVLSPSRPGWKQRHDVEVFIQAGAQGAPVVLSSECPHQGCPVDWKAERYVCPCHGSAFDPNGNLINGPADKPLTKLESFTEDGALWVKVRDLA